MNAVVRLVRHHLLTSFFVLAYVVAWAFWPVGSFGAFVVAGDRRHWLLTTDRSPRLERSEVLSWSG